MKVQCTCLRISQMIRIVKYAWRPWPRAQDANTDVPADGILPPTSLNLDDESINDHQNALIVQDGSSYWIQSCLAKTNLSGDSASLLPRFLPPFHKRRVYTDN